mmetsp:Transcript_32411/g.73154  ORF Transcript_32411/g.73154 Transcript_32411/m.73154 type:complete len:305 (+) Transcript_32411:150-1064(+)
MKRGHENVLPCVGSVVGEKELWWRRRSLEWQLPLPLCTHGYPSGYPVSPIRFQTHSVAHTHGCAMDSPSTSSRPPRNHRRREGSQCLPAPWTPQAQHPLAQCLVLRLLAVPPPGARMPATQTAEPVAHAPRPRARPSAPRHQLTAWRATERARQGRSPSWGTGRSLPAAPRSPPAAAPRAGRSRRCWWRTSRTPPHSSPPWHPARPDVQSTWPPDVSARVRSQRVTAGHAGQRHSARAAGGSALLTRRAGRTRAAPRAASPVPLSPNAVAPPRTGRGTNPVASGAQHSPWPFPPSPPSVCPSLL